MFHYVATPSLLRRHHRSPPPTPTPTLPLLVSATSVSAAPLDHAIHSSAIVLIELPLSATPAAIHWHWHPMFVPCPLAAICSPIRGALCVVRCAREMRASAIFSLAQFSSNGSSEMLYGNLEFMVSQWFVEATKTNALRRILQGYVSMWMCVCCVYIHLYWKMNFSGRK